MDDGLLRQFEDVAGVAAREAYAVTDSGFDDGHGGMLGSVLETVVSLTDHLGRIVGALPGSRAYAAEKAAVVTRCAIRLQAEIAAPDLSCGRWYLVADLADQNGGDDIEESCELSAGHVGQCATNVFRSAAIVHAEDVAVHAAQLAATVYRALKNGWDHIAPVDVRAQIRVIRDELDLIDSNLRAAATREVTA